MQALNTYHFSVSDKQKNIYLDIFFLTIILIINIIFFVIIPRTFHEYFLVTIAIISIFQLVINIFTLKKLGERFFSLSTLFLFFSWVFHFGNIIIYGFNLNESNSFYFFNTVTVETFVNSVIFSFYTQSFVAFGMFFILFKKKIQSKMVISATNYKDENYLFLIRNIGLVLFIIGVGPALYVDLGRLYLFFTSGYVSTYGLSVNGIILIFYNLFRVGIFLLIIGNKKRKSISLSIFLIAVTYQLVIMLSGNRGGAVVELIGLFFIYSNVVKKIRFKNIWPYGIIGYFIILLLSSLTKFRLMSSPNLRELFNLFIDSLKESPILMMLSEFGGTLITVCYSILFFSESENIPYGSNYLLSIFGAFPNIMGIFNEVHRNAIFVSHFPPSYRTFLGGSYIGELYYSFKEWGVLVSTLIGMFIAILSTKIRESILQQKYILLSIYMFIFCDILWWVRGYFIEVVMYPLWISIVIFIVYSFMSKQGKRRSRNYSL